MVPNSIPGHANVWLVKRKTAVWESVSMGSTPTRTSGHLPLQCSSGLCLYSGTRAFSEGKDVAQVTPTRPASPMENAMENTCYLGKSHSSSTFIPTNTQGDQVPWHQSAQLATFLIRATLVCSCVSDENHRLGHAGKTHFQVLAQLQLPRQLCSL